MARETNISTDVMINIASGIIKGAEKGSGQAIYYYVMPSGSTYYYSGNYTTTYDMEVIIASEPCILNSNNLSMKNVKRYYIYGGTIKKVENLSNFSFNDNMYYNAYTNCQLKNVIYYPRSYEGLGVYEYKTYIPTLFIVGVVIFYLLRSIFPKQNY